MTTVASRPDARLRSTRSAPEARRLWLPVAAWGLSRLVLLTVVTMANAVLGRGQDLVEAMRLWDGNWYIEAANGYDVGRIVPGIATGQVDVAFFPAFPVTLRSFAAVTGMPVDAAGVVLNLLIGAVAVVLIWLLVERTADAEAADRTALLFSFFPGSILLSFVYSEPLMLVFVAGCMLALLRRSWFLAGVLGALATATRPNALAICAACVWAAGTALVQRREWSAAWAMVLPPLGFGGYMVWLWNATGEPTAWFRVQREGWGERVDFGGQTWRTINAVLTDPWMTTLSMRLKVAFLVVIVLAGIAMWRWRPPAVLWLYALGIVGLSLISMTLGPRPRFVLTAFPLVAALAWAVRGRAFSLLLAVSATFSSILALVYVIPVYVTP